MPRVSVILKTAQYMREVGERRFGHFDHDATNVHGPMEEPTDAPPYAAEDDGRQRLIIRTTDEGYPDIDLPPEDCG